MSSEKTRHEADRGITSVKPEPAVDLTEIGEQYVIPGCERRPELGPKQMNLWTEEKPT